MNKLQKLLLKIGLILLVITIFFILLSIWLPDKNVELVKNMENTAWVFVVLTLVELFIFGMTFVDDTL